MTIDLSQLNDPDFLAERRRMRQAIEALQERYDCRTGLRYYGLRPTAP